MDEMKNLLDASKLELPRAEWERENDAHTMTLVHLMKNELHGLIMLQEEPIKEDIPGLGPVYSFPKLGPLFDDPEVKHIFLQSAMESKEHGQPVDPILQEWEAKGLSMVDQIKGFPAEPEGATLEQDQLAQEGEGQDRVLAQIPLNLCKLFIQVHGIHPNPEDGLLQFGFFKEIGRAIATVGGAIVGGPVGAAVGNFVGKVATGAKPRDNIIPALKVGAMTGLAQKFLPMIPGMSNLGNMFPAVGSLIGTHAPITPTGPLGSVATMMQSANNALGIGHPGAPTNVPMASVASPTSSSVAGHASTSGVGGDNGLLGNLLKPSNILPLASSALTYMGQKQHEKAQKEMLRRFEEREERERDRSGMDRPWGPPTPKLRQRNLKWTEEQTNSEPPMHYAKGGSVQKNVGFAIKGPGKGQDDFIRTDLKPDDYIVDATTTAHFGDGTTDAGHIILRKFAQKYGGKNLGRANHSSRDIVPSRVSNGETRLPREVVTKMGNGSNARGAKMLDHMVEMIRLHKASGGRALPPKALSPEEYMFS